VEKPQFGCVWEKHGKWGFLEWMGDWGLREFPFLHVSFGDAPTDLFFFAASSYLICVVLFAARAAVPIHCPLLILNENARQQPAVFVFAAHFNASSATAAGGWTEMCK